jgi:AraC family transcriptional regulator
MNEIDGVHLRTRVFGSYESTPFHEHEQPFFSLILEGESEQISGSMRRLRSRGQVFYYPAHEPHSERFGSRGGSVFAIDLPDLGIALPSRSMEITGPAALMARRLYVGAGLRNDAIALDDAMMSLLGVLSRQSTLASRCVTVAREYIHAHFRERLTLNAIAAAANVHPVHLSRAFPQRLGITVGAYVRSLRVDYAAQELCASDRPIIEIALDAGFASQAHLTREFTARIGLSPAAFRRRC